MQINHQSSSRSGNNSQKLLFFLAIAALIAYLIMNHLMLREVIENFFTREVYKSAVYLAWITCAFVVFSAALLTLRRTGLALLLLVSSVSVATNYVYTVVAQRSITPDLMEWMAHETAQLPNAWAEFRPEILAATAMAIGVLAVLLLIRAVVRRKSLVRADLLADPRARALAIGSFLGFHGAAMLIQPSYTVAETNVLVFGLPPLFSQAPQPGEVFVRPAAPARARKILLVVDESVGHGVYADVVAPAVRHLPVIDYGEAASVANCSAATNALLRWGLERPRVGKAGYDPRTNPTIWGLAKAAGFRTTLIDGQSQGAIQNFLSTGELALIDEFVPAGGELDTDHRIAAMLNERLDRPGRDLIYVVKRGAHFPYEMNYPEGTVPPDTSKAGRYAAAVAYSTGVFFELLKKKLASSDILLIYTSDHGQNLNARSTHCNTERHPDEYSVPLMVLTDVESLKGPLLEAAPEMRNRASHLNIFPTLLYGLGYAREWIEATYGPTLAGPAMEYTTLAWHLPYPTKRKDTVDFEITPHFPGRGAQHASGQARDAMTANP
jgi:glucan phosphoethanolaminetransferase (alkaline phosphatase superfamily)